MAQRRNNVPRRVFASDDWLAFIFINRRKALHVDFFHKNDHHNHEGCCASEKARSTASSPEPIAPKKGMNPRAPAITLRLGGMESS